VASCAAGEEAGCPRAEVAQSCDRKAMFDTLSSFVRTQNPYYLAAAVSPGAACGWLSVVSASTRTRWLALPPQVAESSSSDPAGHWLLVPLVASVGDGGELVGAPRRVSARHFEELIAIATTPFEVTAQ
jgi:hypothetical protein